MSYEQHCTKCGAINAQESRLRCDGCGMLILQNEESTSTVQVSHYSAQPFGPEVRENSRSYCAACTAKIDAGLPVWLCAQCGHPRHVHNTGCMAVLGMPDPKNHGARLCCECPEFVSPGPK